MNKVIHFTYISFILLLTVLLAINNITKEGDKYVSESLKMDSYNYNQMCNVNLEQINADNFCVPDTLFLLKENGENILVSTVLKTGDKFVIRFNDVGCMSCIQYFKKHMNDINSFISKVGSENVICLLNSDNPRIIRSFKKQYRFSCEVYGLPIGFLSPVLEVGDTVVAYYFCVLSKDLFMGNCFINIQEFPERTDAYFESIKRKYKISDSRLGCIGLE